jgi:uncharacterized phage protein (TIGR01671 family)
MREILFRGKGFNGEWEYGVPVFSGLNNELAFMKQMHTYDHQVIPKTVGQYTGLTDKNGTKIFEGDIVLFPWGEKREVFSVEFVEGEFEAIPKRKSTDIWCIRIGSYAPEFEVIGNIHDNPELLKGGAE